MKQFYMPTKVFEGGGCVHENKEFWAGMGRRALIVTGRSSARVSGALEDLTDVLDAVSVCYIIYDSVQNNPTVENACEAGAVAREFQADFVIGVGGGSALDCAKAAALFATNDVQCEEIFEEQENAPLPIAAIPTTAGTGSEVTPISVLTVNSIKSKKSIRCDSLFPVAAFLDSRYTRSMPAEVAIYTALDAVSHCAESIISLSSSDMSEYIAAEGLRLLGRYIRYAVAEPIDDEAGEKLLHAAMLGGQAIAQTGTIIVHSMGYALTYYKNVPHGLANGLLLPAFMKRVQQFAPGRAKIVLDALGMRSVQELYSLVDFLDLERPLITEENAKFLSNITIKNKNVVKTPWKVTQQQEQEMMLEI